MLQSVTRTCEILEVLREQRKTTLTEIQAEVDLNIATVHTHLATLIEQGFVVREGQMYKLGPKLITFGETVRHMSDLYEAGRDEIERLANETGEAAYIHTEQNGLEVPVCQSFGSEAIGRDLFGKLQEVPSWHLHWTAGGKSILAYLSEERLEEIIDEHGLPSQTTNTITDREELLEELEIIREQGYALNDEEEVIGLRAVGAPIFGQNSEVVGAASLGGPRARFDDERFNEEIPQLVKQSANSVEVNLQAQNL
jgi:DNA-binding IclR family transcriptional regulator